MTLLISSCLWVIFVFIERATYFSIFISIFRVISYFTMFYGIIRLIVKVMRKKEILSFAVKVILIALFNYFYLAGIAYKAGNFAMTAPKKKRLKTVSEVAYRNSELRNKKCFRFIHGRGIRTTDESDITARAKEDSLRYYQGIDPVFADSLVNLIKDLRFYPNDVEFNKGSTSIEVFGCVFRRVRLHYRPGIGKDVNPFWEFIRPGFSDFVGRDFYLSYSD